MVIQFYIYSHTQIYFSDSFPLNITIRYRIEFPVIYSRFLFTILHIVVVYVNPKLPNFSPPPHAIPSGKQFVFYVCESISVLQISSFLSFLRFHI